MIVIGDGASDHVELQTQFFQHGQGGLHAFFFIRHVAAVMKKEGKGIKGLDKARYIVAAVPTTQISRCRPGPGRGTVIGPMLRALLNSRNRRKTSTPNCL